LPTAQYLTSECSGASATHSLGIRFRRVSFERYKIGASLSKAEGKDSIFDIPSKFKSLMVVEVVLEITCSGAAPAWQELDWVFDCFELESGED
jgi:hypothetical protein